MEGGEVGQPHRSQLLFVNRPDSSGIICVSEDFVTDEICLYIYVILSVIALLFSHRYFLKLGINYFLRLQILVHIDE